MDRLSRLRAEAGPSPDDSEASDTGFQTADNTVGDTSTYLSFSDDEGSTQKQKGANPAESTPARPADDGFSPGVSPISQAKGGFGGHIDARNILSGGVDIFDDYNSNDGDGLVIDDDAANTLDEDEGTASQPTEKVICEPIESANLPLSTDAGLTLKDISESQLGDADVGASPEQPFMNYDVILQIDGNNVDAVDIGNGLYLYRKDEGGELNAIQILEEEGQQPHFKFLKVREFGEGNLEVYEEVPITDEELEDRKKKESKEKENVISEKPSHLPIKDVNKALVLENTVNCKTVALNSNVATKEDYVAKSDTSAQKTKFVGSENLKQAEGTSDGKPKPNPLKNLEGSRKSPILGNFTSMTLHSSPNREGVPLTKTTINLPLNPSRHSDSIKKTIEVSTDQSNLKCNEKSTILSSLLPKLDAINKVPYCEETEETHIIVPNEKDGLKEKNMVLVKPSDGIALSEANSTLNDKKHINDKMSVDTNKQLHNDVKLNTLESKTDDGKFYSDISGEVKTIDDSKLYISDRSQDSKKDLPTNKSNVVSKWVLRSDSTEDKCKKEKDKNPLETKPAITVKQSNDISTKSDTNDVPLKHTNITPIATNVKKIINEEVKEVKSPVCKPSLKSTIISETKGSENVCVDSCELNPKPITTHNEEKCFHSKKIMVRKIEDKNKQVEEEKKFVNKYITEAFCMKKVSPVTVESLHSESLKNKVELDNKIKSTEKQANSSKEKEKSYDSPLRIDIETPSKPVPFGKWTDGDKKEYLNKLKDQKQPSSNPSLSPAKSYQLASSKNDLKRLELKKRADTFERAHLINALQSENPIKPDGKAKLPVTDMKGLIDKTIEGMIKDQLEGTTSRHSLLYAPIKTIHDPSDKSALDELERQMNELHGIPLLEKPVPNLYASNVNSNKSVDKVISKTESSESTTLANKPSKIPNLLPLNNSNKDDGTDKKFGEDEESEEEIIDCEPVTGDMPWVPQKIQDTKKSVNAGEQKNLRGYPSKINAQLPRLVAGDKKSGITEVEFDKFVRRNSTNQLITSENNSMKKTYENETKCNRDTVTKSIHTENNLKKSINLLGSQRSNASHIPQSIHAGKKISNDPVESFNLLTSQSDDSSHNMNYHTKLQLAYQSALSAKSQKEPVKIIEDKPVKIPFVGSNSERVSSPQKLSAAKQISAVDNVEAMSSCDSTASGAISSADEGKPLDQNTIKYKHPRKQVLTPVESPLIELIEPSDEQQQKKKRKSETKTHEDLKSQATIIKRDFKNVAPKKNYLLGRVSLTEELNKDDLKENPNNNTKESNIVTVTKSAIQQMADVNNTPKRGRGRPRKYPIKNSPEVSQIPDSPKKPKSSVSDKDKTNSIISDETEDENSDEEGIIRENWTMGKINDKIVCPICNKLFRSENIVFKHVKHCSSLLKSPSKRPYDLENESSPKKVKKEENTSVNLRNTEKSNRENISVDNSKADSKMNSIAQDFLKSDHNVISLVSPAPNHVIVIDDSPITEESKSVKAQGDNINSKQSATVTVKQIESTSSQQKVTKIGRPRSVVNHTCEICGKTFRQLSYLLHHRSLHNKESTVVENKPILSCEICRKEFRQLHYLVEHREIHNTATNMGIQRKKSLDRSEPKQKEVDSFLSKENLKKQNEKPSEPFRCEPCDKSFRKLHHLVEHRETHDGLNKKNSPQSQAALENKADKPVPASPTCDVCGKAFRKLHHLIEHREQHNDASAVEKKERKPTLLAKDIIHECSLCYMVFPNEPSLNKHFVFCQKKKKSTTALSTDEPLKDGQHEEATAEVTSQPKEIEVSSEPLLEPVASPLSSKRSSKEILLTDTLPTESELDKKILTEELTQTPKKKTLKPSNLGVTVTKPAKIGATVTKRGRPSLTPLDENFELKSIDSEDEVRYMINPSYKQDSDEEREIFMNICVGKRNSLQFDSTSAKAEFKKRRTSLQHPPKNSKLLPKKVEKLSKPPNVPSEKMNLENKLSSSAVPSTSSLAEDSDIKYSFPKTAKVHKLQSKISIAAPKIKRNNLTPDTTSTQKVDKRKSLTGIAKRKSLGKSAAMKPTTAKYFKSETMITVPKKGVKKQISEAMHVCDCGKRYTSGTLLEQHTLVAHTPPRIRKLRNPDTPPVGAGTGTATGRLAKKRTSVTKHAGVPVALKKLRDHTDKLDK